MKTRSLTILLSYKFGYGNSTRATRQARCGLNHLHLVALPPAHFFASQNEPSRLSVHCGGTTLLCNCKHLHRVMIIPASLPISPPKGTYTNSIFIWRIGYPRASIPWFPADGTVRPCYHGIVLVSLPIMQPSILRQVVLYLLYCTATQSGPEKVFFSVIVSSFLFYPVLQIFFLSFLSKYRTEVPVCMHLSCAALHCSHPSTDRSHLHACC